MSCFGSQGVIDVTIAPPLREKLCGFHRQLLKLITTPFFPSAVCLQRVCYGLFGDMVLKGKNSEHTQNSSRVLSKRH